MSEIVTCMVLIGILISGSVTDLYRNMLNRGKTTPISM